MAQDNAAFHLTASETFKHVKAELERKFPVCAVHQNWIDFLAVQ